MSSEIERRLSEMIRVGVISEVRPDEGLCRVSFGRRPSPLSKWIAGRAGTDRDWWHPDVGEQVLYLSPYGDGSEGFALPGLYSTKRPAPDRAREDRHVIEYGDGTRVEVDREEHRVEIVDSYGSAIRMIDGYIYLAPAKQVRIIQGGR